VSYGSSGIVDPDGIVVQAARELSEDLLVAEIDTTRRAGVTENHITSRKT
jgi:predicted amidohydrolase